MIKINDNRETNRSHLADECDPGTTLIDADGCIFLCVLNEDTNKHQWVVVDTRTSNAVAVLVGLDEAFGKLCSIEVKVLER